MRSPLPTSSRSARHLLLQSAEVAIGGLTHASEQKPGYAGLARSVRVQKGRPCVAEPMHSSIGIESMKLMREALPAILRALAFCSSVAGTMPRIFFWFGQISTQTLNSMIVPSHAPMPIDHLVQIHRIAAQPEREGAAEVAAAGQVPGAVSQVETRAQRNQSSARGATYLVMPAPPGPPLSAAAAARPGSARH